MKNIADVDSNFKVETKLEKDNIKFYNPNQAPFKVHGVYMDNGKYRRFPEEIAATVSEGVHYLHGNTAGGRVRFKTDSSYVAISCVLENAGRMPHFAFTGSMGFDLYVGDVYKNTFVPPFDAKDGYESVGEFGTRELREITINFPLYSNVKELYIGLEEEAVVEQPSPYKTEKPIVYYGSSITQGGCASRPGMSYESIISRRFDCDFINLGFTGNARGEAEIADYIKKLDMSLFVYDYDHNAPTVEHLQNTHEKMFQAIRNENPNLPIIIMSRPKFNLTEEEVSRRNIIETTYKNAVSAGDKNVYFLDNKALTELCGSNGTVDGCHPTDFGFASMAKAVGDVIEKYNCL